MNDEIKEMLHCIEMNCKHNKCFGGVKLDEEDCKLLLDYITNLQQKDFESQKEITKLKDKLERQRKEYQDDYKDVRIEIKEKNERIANLQQENEKLKYNARGQVNDYFKDKYADEVLKNAKLKEENDFLKLNNPEQNMEHFRIVKENKRKIDNLRKENKRLKEELKNRPIVDFTFDVCKDLEELEDYKSRFKKTIEYIDEHTLFVNGGIIKSILNGSDDE